ncbi:MAG: hypothetical protein ABJB01_02145 [Rudaea sp.]
MLAEAQRRDMLAAMDIEVYVLRGAVAPKNDSASSDGEWLVVAASDAVLKSPQCAHLRKSLPTVLGIEADHIRWLAADADNSFETVPLAHAYLVLGAALARSLGAHLSATQQNTSVIAVADEPSISFGSAISKCALWQTLKPIARRARELH